MAKFIDIAVKNLKMLIRDKKVLLTLILIPIFYYSLMGSIFGSVEKSNSQATINTIGWVNEDTTNPFHPIKNQTYIYGVIDGLDNMQLENCSSDSKAKELLDNQDLDAYVVIPQGFELYINKLGPNQTIKIYFRDTTETITRNIVSSTIIGVIEGIINYNPSEVQIQYSVDTITGEKINELTFSTPGYLMYGILMSLVGGVILVTGERKEGLLKRLESSCVTPKDMILGHLITNTAVIVTQFLIGVGVLALFGFSPNYNDFGSLFFGLGITLLLLSFFQNALILVASALLKTPEAVGGGAWLIMAPLMLFSGAFFPLELLTPGLVPYVAWIPTRIVVIIFKELMINSTSIWNPFIWQQLLLLAVEGVLTFILGMKLYRKFVQSS
jgi:ABC-type multidrug transport system permease subunit